MCASVTDIYGPTFGKSLEEERALHILKENQKCAEKNEKYQQFLKHNEIAGKANFKEQCPDKILPENKLPGPPPNVINDSTSAKRLAWTDINNEWPYNQGVSMYNRFQNPIKNSLKTLFGYNNDIEYLSNEDCIHHLVKLVKELLLMIKIIMFVLILLFLIKILDKRN